MKRNRDADRKPGGQRSQRQLRVGEVLRQALCAVLERDIVRDPDLAGVAVTVTEVRASPDLRSATAFVMPLGGRETEKIVDALRRAAPFLRHAIGREVTLKYLPAIRFEADTSFDQAGRIDELLRDSNPPASDTPASDIDEGQGDGA